MEIIQHAHNHHIHPDLVMVIDDVKHMLASNYTSLLTHIDSHIDNDHVHISIEDRDRWDNKADKVSLYDLELRLANKADRTDVIELQEALAKIKATVSGTDGSDGKDGAFYVTEREVGYMIDAKNFVTQDALSLYATKEWCNDLFLKKSDYHQNNSDSSGTTTIDTSQFATKSDLSNYVTKSELATAISNIDSGSSQGGDGSGSGSSGSGSGSDGGDVFTQDEVDQIIENVQRSLGDILDRERQAVRDASHDIIVEGKQWLDRLNDGETLPESMAWVADAEAFIQKVAHKDANGNTVTWSTFYQDYNNLKNSVNQLTLGYDQSGNVITQETLQSLVNTAIEGNTAIAELKSRYELTDQDETVLRWLSSGFHSEASANKSVAQVFASMEDIEADESRIAALETAVSENGTATAALATRVTNIEGTQGTSSGYVTQSELSRSIGIMFSTNNVTYDNARDAIEDIVEGKIDTAYIYTAINDAGQSQAKIHADKIDLDGVVTNLTANTAFIDDLTANTAFISKLTATQGFIDALSANTATVAREVQVGNNGGTTVSITASGSSAGMLVTSSQGTVAIGDTVSTSGADTAIIPGSVSTNNLNVDNNATISNRLIIGGVSGIVLPSSGVATFNNGLTAGSGGSTVQIPNNVSGSFTTADGKTITVTGGIITSIA